MKIWKMILMEIKEIYHQKLSIIKVLKEYKKKKV
jgi:hypothetical protein